VDTSTAKSTDSDLELARKLMLTCYEMYRLTPTGLAPEIVHFTKHAGDYPKQHIHDVGHGHFEASHRIPSLCTHPCSSHLSANHPSAKRKKALPAQQRPYLNAQ
jgi:hypothetical protein